MVPPKMSNKPPTPQQKSVKKKSHPKMEPTSHNAIGVHQPKKNKPQEKRLLQALMAVGMRWLVGSDSLPPRDGFSA